MQCPQCQNDNPDRAKFCPECGSRLAGLCLQCGTELPTSAKFCLECGQPADGRAASAPPSPPRHFASPQAYTPQHLAERILTSRTALEGERKQMTVLFADLKGSMELLAERDPEEARSILDPILQRMMDAVHRYEGTVNQVIGDGIMALFGAPLAHEDHAVRACYAALRMQQSVKEYAQEVQRTHGVPIHIRVGLNSGEVVVRSIGSDLRMDYSAVGPTTHLGARMEQVAMPGSILLAPHTFRLAEGYVQVKALGPVQVRGLGEPVEVYELIGAGTARSRLQAAVIGGLTRFVGRDAELEVLRRTLEQAGSGHGQIVALVGEPGVGKSRLVWEFTRSHRTQGWLVLEARSVSYGKASAYLPVIDLLRTYFQIEGQDNHRSMRQKVLGKVLDLDEALRRTVPALLSLLDVPTEDAAWHALDPPQRRQRTVAAIKQLLLRESQVQPLLLVFEDLHWIDAETQALLDSLVDSMPTARILLLVNYRPEYEHGWHHKTSYQQLRLDPLPPTSAEELLQAMLGDDPSLTALKPQLIERTEGNPFFLEECVRSLTEAGALTGEPGARRLVSSSDNIRVPATVQAVLAARLDRLPPENKRLLACAAVIGKDVPYPLLREIAELREEWLRQALLDLQAAEFLYEASLFPEPEYTFKHALTHEVAYSRLLQERRRVLHARIVQAVERLYPDRLAEHVELLAHHALRAEVWDKAVVYLRRAGAKVQARSAHREAVGYLEQALLALGQLPESQETVQQAIDLRFDLRLSSFVLGEIEQDLDRLHEAKTLAESLGDERRLGRAHAYLANCFWNAGDYGSAIDSGQRALAVADALGDLTIQVQMNHYLGLAYVGAGAYAQALEFFRRNIECLAGDLIYERFGLPGLPAMLSRAWGAAALAERGEFAAGRSWVEETERLARTVDHPFTLAGSFYSIARFHLRRGGYAQAIPALERATGLCQLGGIPHLLVEIGTHLGYAYALSGRMAEALPLLEEAVEQSVACGFRAMQSRRVAHLSEAYLLAGRPEDAAACALRALALSHDFKERGHEGWTLRLLGDISASATPTDPALAESYYHQALALAEELEMRPLAAQCHLGLGTLYRRAGSRERANAELAEAASMYQALEMPLWIARTDTALA